MSVDNDEAFIQNIMMPGSKQSDCEMLATRLGLTCSRRQNYVKTSLLDLKGNMQISSYLSLQRVLVDQKIICFSAWRGCGYSS